jgi:hypothetical protein
MTKGNPLNKLKKEAFFSFLREAGRVFIHVRPSEEVMLGRRGFVAQEEKEGIILVFNQKMQFSWDTQGISARLLFGQRWEDCFIPAEHIVSVFSPEMGAQLTIVPPRAQEQAEPPKGDKVIKVDFRRGGKGERPS